jgi:hypothetical protein
MTTFNALPFDILSRVLDYNSQVDISSLSLGCKQNRVDIKSIRELTQAKRIREKTNFIKTLRLYIDKYNNDSEQYLFDILKIKEYFKLSHLNDKSLFMNGTNDFSVDGNMVNITTEKSLHIENLIETVIEFQPEQAYGLVESIAYRDSNNTEMLLDGMIIYNYRKMVYVLINHNRINHYSIEGLIRNQYEKYQGKLVTVILGPLVTTIRKLTFVHCSKLKSIIIPNSVTTIEEYTFNVCSNLESIILPNSLTSIGDAAFSYCSSLKSIIIPNSLTSIGHGAFVHCSKLKSIIIPKSVTSIGNRTFNVCSSLKSIIIPNSVTSIGSRAFDDCNSLKSIIIPNSVTSIGYYAFKDCSSLTSVIIPNSVTSIGDGAFSGCTNLHQ